MRDERNGFLSTYGNQIIVGLLTLVFGLVSYSYAQNLDTIQKDRVRDTTEIQRLGSVQREVVERLKGVEVKVDGLTRTVEENRKALEKNSEKLDLLIQRQIRKDGK